MLLVALGIAQSVRRGLEELASAKSSTGARIAELRSQRAKVDVNEQSAIDKEIERLEGEIFRWDNLRWGVLAMAVPFGFLGLMPPGVFWRITLRHFGHALPFIPTMATYLVGGLGKYVPGKAMVLILRSRGLHAWHVPISVSIVSIIVETLLALSAGATAATYSLAMLPVPFWLRTILIVTTAVSLVPLAPPLFREVLKRMGRSKRLSRFMPNIPVLPWTLIGCGWLWSLFGQLLLSAGLFCVCSAIPWTGTAHSGGWSSLSWLSLYTICVAATTMGFVIGFLSMLPGGAGARELVVTIVLSPVLGYASAIVAAVLYRLITLISDLGMAGLFFLLARSTKLKQSVVREANSS